MGNNGTSIWTGWSRSLPCWLWLLNLPDMIAVTAVMPQIHLLHITTHYYTLLHITILEPIVLARVMDHNVQDEKTALKVSFGRTSSESPVRIKLEFLPHHWATKGENLLISRVNFTQDSLKLILRLISVISQRKFEINYESDVFWT